MQRHINNVHEGKKSKIETVENVKTEHHEEVDMLDVTTNIKQELIEPEIKIEEINHNYDELHKMEI